MPIEFRDRVALVTGAASGIGESVAMRLASEGARVLLVDIDRAGLETVARQIKSSGGWAESYVTDVSNAAQVAQLHNRVTTVHGTPDFLINSAGVVISGSIEQIPLDEWKWALGVNLWGIIHTVHCFAEEMYARGSGHIVNLASAAGLFALPYVGVYTTSKFAVVGFSRVLRTEAAVHGVNVLTVCPGFVRTPMLDNVKSVGMEVDSSETSPMKRFAMCPEKLTDNILKAMEKRRSLLVCPRHMKLIYDFSRLFPRIWDGLLSINARVTQKAMGVKR